MALGNTPRTETIISVEANKSFVFGMYFKSADDTPIDLTNAELRFVAADIGRHAGTEVLTKVAVPMLDNPAMLQFEFQAEDLALDFGTYAYDVTLIPESGYSTPILKGQLEVGANTDIDISNVYDDVGTGTDVTVYLHNHDLVEVVVERLDGLFLLVRALILEFREEMAANAALMQARLEEALAAAAQAAISAEELRNWFESVGFPFWRGTQAEYDAILEPNPLHLYLIVEEGMAG
jgi:hypothetical protein